VNLPVKAKAKRISSVKQETKKNIDSEMPEALKAHASHFLKSSSNMKAQRLRGTG